MGADAPQTNGAMKSADSFSRVNGRSKLRKTLISWLRHATDPDSFAKFFDVFAKSFDVFVENGAANFFEI